MALNYLQTANKVNQEEGTPEETIVSYQKAIEENPRCYFSYRNLGEALAKLLRWDDAIACYKKAIELESSEYKTHYRLGEALQRRYELDSAEVIAIYRRAVELNPSSMEAYQNLLKLQPESWELWWQFGQVLEQDNRLDEAIAAYQRVIELKSDDCMPAYKNLLETQPENWENWLHLGKMLGKKKQWEKAIAAYQRVIKLKPDSREGHWQLGLALWQQGKHQEALESYQRALALKPDWAEGHFSLGAGLCQLGKQEEGIRSYQKAVRLKPDWSDACLQLGNVLLQQGRQEEAVEVYQKALTLKPDWTEGHWHLGLALWRQGKHQEALESYQKALALKPHWAEGHFYLASALLEIGQHKEAIENYQQAVALKPQLEANFKKSIFSQMKSKGYHLAGQGLMKEACQSFEAALDAQKDLAKIHQFTELGICILAQSFTAAIGHTALYIDLYVKINQLGWGESNRPILLVDPEKTANLCYVHYWGRYMPVISDPLLLKSFSLLTESFQEISGILVRCKQQYIWWAEAIALVEKQWNAEGRAPLLSLSASDTDRGWDCLEKFGFTKNSWFVCIHAREPGYAQQLNGVSYQNHRNVDIDTYLLAIKTIVARGGWVIRMGDPSMKPLPPLVGVIDYAHSNFKSDWMDVFLCAKCRFFLGDTSGICLVSYTFGIPCVLTNVVPIANRAFSSKNISIPKLLWSVKEDRYLSFAEAWEPPFEQHYKEDFLHKHELRLVDNTAEDVEDLTLEMLERLEGTVEYTAEDQRLQEIYNSLGANTCGSFGVNSRIGRDFLRKYAKSLLKED